MKNKISKVSIGGDAPVVSKIMVGPIQKSMKTVDNTISSKIQENLKKMKVGNFFEVDGVQTSREFCNLRASISYFTKRNGLSVTTSKKGNKLVITKLKSKNETQRAQAV